MTRLTAAHSASPPWPAAMQSRRNGWTRGLVGVTAVGTTLGLGHTALQWVDVETAYYAQTALVLVGVLAAIVAGFALASFLAVRALERLLRGPMSRSYILFLGWNMLRSQRSTAPWSRRLALRATSAVGGRTAPNAFLAWAAFRTGWMAAAAGIAYFGWVIAPWFEPPVTAAVRAVAYSAGLWALWQLVSIVSVSIGWGLRGRASRGPATRLRATVTVPNFISMVGVGVGVWALILVLSVMSGFQSRVRENILATDAHVLVQPKGGSGPLSGALDKSDALRATAGVQSAEAYFEAECMIASSFNSRVQLTVRGFNVSGPMAERLRPSVVDGSLDLLDHPERLVSFRGFSLAESAASKRAETRREAPPPTPDDGTGGIEMPPIPGGSPPRSATAIEMPPIPGSQPPAETTPAALLADQTAQALGVGVGDRIELSILSQDSPTPSTATLRVVGVYRKPEADVDRPEIYVAPKTLGRLSPGQSRALVTVRARDSGAQSAFVGAATPDSPDVAALSGDLVAGSLDDIFADAAATSLERRPFDGARIGGDAFRLLPSIAVGVELADSLRVRVGDELELISLEAGVGPMGVMPKAATFRVAAIFRTGIYDFDLKLAYTSTPEALRFFDAGTEANRIEVRLDDASDPDKIRPHLLAAVPDVEILDWKALNRNLFSALALEKIVMFLVLGLIIAVASFNIVASLAMLIQEKSTEIAILRAMGGTRHAIRRTFLTVGAFVGTIGALTGTSLGLLSCYLIDSLGVPLPPQYYIPTVPVEVNGLEVAAASLAALLISLLATLYPAGAAARLRPVEGLRYE